MTDTHRSQLDHAASDPQRALDGLVRCVDKLRHGPWTFVQLRGLPLDASCINRGDVDLLASRAAVRALVDAAFGWVQDGLCHVRVKSRSREKVELTLFSPDGRHRAVFDLWMILPQLARGRRQLQFADCLPHLPESASSIRHLPVVIEACLYIHHLLCKRKDLADEQVQARLRRYADACMESEYHDLAARLDRIGRHRRITPEDEQAIQSHLVAHWGQPRPGRPYRRGIAGQLLRLRNHFLAPPRRAKMACIMGCDGIGKTTLLHRIAAMLAGPCRVLTGKHLYRKSLTYKLAVIFIRPLLLRDREDFDQTLAPLVYLRACASLRWRLWRMWRSGTLTLMDRSIVDFLFIDRKRRQPRLARTSWLAHVFGCRIPTIHCIARYETLAARKQEVTRTGQAAYDLAMFQAHAHRVPTDYVVFNNEMNIDDAAPALARMLTVITPLAHAATARGTPGEALRADPERQPAG